MSPELPRLYIITDRTGRDLVAAIDAALERLPPAGALVQVREKDLEGRELLSLVRAILAVAGPRECPVLVNDRIDVALAAGAAGAHLPESGFDIETARQLLGPDAIIGVSRHTAEGVLASIGADLIAYGPVWPTPSKPGAAGIGLAALAEAVTLAGSIPVYALGGIDTGERARAVLDAGAHGVAGIRGLLDGDLGGVVYGA